MKFYQYPKCSTCIKARKFLDSKSIAYDSINIVENPPTLKELKQVLKSCDNNLKKLLNTSGQVYRELNLKDKISSMSKDEILNLLVNNGKLIKRPLFISSENNLVGFKQNEWDSIC